MDPDLLALADTEHLRARVTRLVDRMLDDIEWELDNAPPAARQQLLRSALPVVMKALSEREQVDEEMERVRAEVATLNERVVNGLLSVPTTAIETTVVGE